MPSLVQRVTLKRGGQGLSTGAKAGTDVGAALGGLTIIALVVFFWRRRKGGDKVEPNNFAPPPEKHAHHKQLLPEYSQPEKKQRELQGSVHEICTAPEAQELPDTSEVRQR